jgi:hypothetical protein
MIIAHHHGERFYEAEICRLTGELLLRQASGSGGKPMPTVEAEARLRQAADIAGKHQANALALRAVISITRLWQQ